MIEPYPELRQATRSFAPQLALATEIEEGVKLFHHGYTDQEVAELEAKYFNLFKRDIVTVPTTFEEFKTIIIPYLRTQRTEAFNLYPETKPKVAKAPREPKAPRQARAVKPKKLKKEDIPLTPEEEEEYACSSLHFRKLRSNNLTEEEEVRLAAYKARQVDED